jgi:uncharacterized delta-60 repeat protein
LDLTFGGTGVVLVQTFENSRAVPAAIGIQPSGNIVIAGNIDPTHPTGIHLFAFTADGARADTFGSDGFVVSTILDSVSDMAIQKNGKIVLAGNIVGDAIGLARFGRNGELDFAFGEGGLAQINSSEGARAGAIALQRNGKIVVGGTVFEPETALFALARFRPNGKLDARFGEGGLATGPQGND